MKFRNVEIFVDGRRLMASDGEGLFVADVGEYAAPHRLDVTAEVEITSVGGYPVADADEAAVALRDAWCNIVRRSRPNE